MIKKLIFVIAVVMCALIIVLNIRKTDHKISLSDEQVAPNYNIPAKKVSWETAMNLLKEHPESIVEIAQSHALDVTFTLKNGELITAKEPSIDYIFSITDKCGSVCSHIRMATE